jgi:hypothetical protein
MRLIATRASLIMIGLLLFSCSDSNKQTQFMSSPWYLLSEQDYKKLKSEEAAAEQQGNLDLDALRNLNVSTLLFLDDASFVRFTPNGKSVAVDKHDQMPVNIDTLWHDDAITLFVDANNNFDLQAYGERINQATDLDVCVTTCRLLPSPFFGGPEPSPSALFEALTIEHDKVALQARQQNLKQRLAMYLTHQFTSAGTVLMTSPDILLTQQDKNWNSFYSSLIELRERYVGLFVQKSTVYEADNERRLLAFRTKTSAGEAAYIVYNFSFDIHEVPLPFGFMTSTKVTLWQSDTANVTTFVTDAPLMISPYSAVIIITE